MTLQEAIILIERLQAETNKKSEIRAYESFHQILISLKNRDLVKAEIESIEAKLDSFNLDSKHVSTRKFIKKIQKEFLRYLRETYSLLSKGYYTNLGVGLGSSFGILFGIVFLASFERPLGLALGLSLGMVVGLLIGKSFDAKVKSEGRML